jgi:hypothetical protein
MKQAASNAGIAVGVFGLLMAVWLAPIALGWAPGEFSVKKTLDAYWPLLAGGALAALWHWIRRRFGPEAEKHASGGAAHHDPHDHEEPEAESEAGLEGLGPVGGQVLRWESGLRNWVLAGSLLVGCVVLLWCVLRAGGG